MRRSYVLDERTFSYVERCLEAFQRFLSTYRRSGYQWKEDFEIEKEANYLRENLKSKRIRNKVDQQVSSFNSNSNDLKSEYDSVVKKDKNDSKSFSTSEKSKTISSNIISTFNEDYQNNSYDSSSVQQKISVKSSLKNKNKTSLYDEHKNNSNKIQDITIKKKTSSKHNLNANNGRDLATALSKQMDEMKSQENSSKLGKDDARNKSSKNDQNHTASKISNDKLSPESVELSSLQNNNSENFSRLNANKKSIITTDNNSDSSKKERNRMKSGENSVKSNTQIKNKNSKPQQTNYYESEEFEASADLNDISLSENLNSQISEEVISEDKNSGTSSDNTLSEKSQILKEKSISEELNLERKKYTRNSISNEDTLSEKSSKSSSKDLNSKSSYSPINMKNVHFFPISAQQSEERKLSSYNLELSSVVNEKNVITKLNPNKDSKQSYKTLKPYKNETNTKTERSLNLSDISNMSSKQPTLTSIESRLQSSHEKWSQGRGNSLEEEIETDMEVSDVEECCISVSSLSDIDVSKF